MRKYVSSTDMLIVRKAIMQVGIAGGFLRVVAKALRDNGIEWPNLQGNSAEAKAVDNDCTAVLMEIMTDSHN